MPQLALFGVEGLVQSAADHVFDADEPGVGSRGIIDEALADVWVDGRVSVMFDCGPRLWGGRGMSTFVEVGAVVVGFYASAGIGGVDMEGVEVGTDLFDWGEVLLQRNRWLAIGSIQ